MDFARTFFRGRQHALASPKSAKASKAKKTDEGAYMPTSEEIAQRAKEIRQAKGLPTDDTDD